MPNFDTYKRLLSHKGNNVGDVLKSHSDIVMEATWDRDIQSKTCYIYDYFHDDQPELNKNMSYTNTTKTRIDAKFIITQYSSLIKDQVEYHIMFKPSQKTFFSKLDDLYYYETDYVKKYDMTFPIGMYIDIPDEKNVYYKWLICGIEYGNQFVKYSILPCDYHLFWVEETSTSRNKRQIWCVSRAMNSYTSGLWIDQYFSSLDDINKLWLPLNKLTSKIHYLNGCNKNQRLIVSAPVEKPLTWRISKLENTKPIGILKITLDQDSFNPYTDYVNLETGEMYADYYSSFIQPSDTENSIQNKNLCELSCVSNTIKCGGSYKLITAKFYNEFNVDITDICMDSITMDSWKCFIDDEDFTSNSFVSWKMQQEKNKIRIKLSNNKSFLTKILTIQCHIQINDVDFVGSLPLEIVSL